MDSEKKRKYENKAKKNLVEKNKCFPEYLSCQNKMQQQQNRKKIERKQFEQTITTRNFFFFVC